METAVLFYIPGLLLPPGTTGVGYTVQSYLKRVFIDHQNDKTYNETATDVFPHINSGKSFIHDVIRKGSIVAFNNNDFSANSYTDTTGELVTGRAALGLSLGRSRCKFAYSYPDVDKLVAYIREHWLTSGAEKALKAKLQRKARYRTVSEENILKKIVEITVNSQLKSYDKMKMYLFDSLVFARDLCTKLDLVVKRNSPLFTLQTCNNLHNMSAYLAYYAFKRCGNPSYPNLILNFDAHKDMGNVNVLDVQVKGRVLKGLTSGKCVCENGPWGATLPRLFSNTGYICFQTSGKVQGRKVHRLFIDKNHTSQNSESAQLSDASSYLSWVRRNIKGRYNIYITVDRDYIMGSWTGFDSGFLRAEKGREMVRDCVRMLARQGCNFVGFDLTGFPGQMDNEKSPKPHDGNYESRSTFGYNRTANSIVEDPWTLLRLDLGFFYRLMESVSTTPQPGDQRFGKLLDLTRDIGIVEAHTLNILSVIVGNFAPEGFDRTLMFTPNQRNFMKSKWFVAEKRKTASRWNPLSVSWDADAILSYLQKKNKDKPTQHELNLATRPKRPVPKSGRRRSQSVFSRGDHPPVNIEELKAWASGEETVPPPPNLLPPPPLK